MLNGEKATIKPFQFFLAASSPSKFDFGSASLITFNHAITSGKLIAGYVCMQHCVQSYKIFKLAFWTTFYCHLKRFDFLVIRNGFWLMVKRNLPHKQNGLNRVTQYYILVTIMLQMNTIWVLFSCQEIHLEVTGTTELNFNQIPIKYFYFYLFLDVDFLRPIALPNNNIVVPRYNEEGCVSGFGVALNMGKPSPNEDLKTTYFTVIKENECPIVRFHAQEASNFCARDLVMSSRLCKGDTGSGFITLQRGIPILVINFYSNFLSLFISLFHFSDFCFVFVYFLVNLTAKTHTINLILVRLVLHHKCLGAVRLAMVTMPLHSYVFTLIWDGSKRSPERTS